MDKLTRKALRGFYFGDISPRPFEEWLYKDSVLEKLFPDEYLTLISLDYKRKEDCWKAKETIRKIYDTRDPELLFKHKTLETVRGMLDETIPLENGCQLLTDWYDEGMTFIPIGFVGYDSEFTDERRRDTFDMLAFYSDEIIEDCKILLNDLKQYAEDV